MVHAARFAGWDARAHGIGIGRFIRLRSFASIRMPRGGCQEAMARADAAAWRREMRCNGVGFAGHCLRSQQLVVLVWVCKGIEHQYPSSDDT